MNNIHVTVNLCAEDRARIDKIIDLLVDTAVEVDEEPKAE